MSDFHKRVVTSAHQACGTKVVAATGIDSTNATESSFDIEVITDELFVDRYTPKDVVIEVRFNWSSLRILSPSKGR